VRIVRLAALLSVGLAIVAPAWGDDLACLSTTFRLLGANV